jgi:lipopolysaccharide assembly protein A
MPGGAPPKRRRRAPAKLIVTLLLLAALIWFIAVNTHDVEITVFVPTYNVPAWIVLLGTFIVGWIVGVLFRRRRRSVKAKAIKNNL